MIRLFLMFISRVIKPQSHLIARFLSRTNARVSAKVRLIFRTCYDCHDQLLTVIAFLGLVLNRNAIIREYSRTIVRDRKYKIGRR